VSVLIEVDSLGVGKLSDVNYDVVVIRPTYFAFEKSDNVGEVGYYNAQKQSDLHDTLLYVSDFEEFGGVWL
jgi:hypothetical protein